MLPLLLLQLQQVVISFDESYGYALHLAVGVAAAAVVARQVPTRQDNFVIGSNRREVFEHHSNLQKQKPLAIFDDIVRGDKHQYIRQRFVTNQILGIRDH